MDKSLIRAWIEALRSGNYDQWYGILRSSFDDSRFCALGVAIDVHPHKESLWQQYNSEAETRLSISSYPPKNVQVEFGLNLLIDESRIPTEMKHGGRPVTYARAVTYMNDCLLWCFDDIATWLEENLLNREA